MRIARIASYSRLTPSMKSRAVLGPNRAADGPAPLAIDKVLVIIAIIGIVLRILRYAHNRSLWLDEIFLSNNLIHKSAAQLLGTLDYRQGAPPLFLLLCKAAISLLGSSEYALRLIPLLAGIGSVIVFAALVRNLLGGWPAIAAMALFALLEPLVYYSSEVKQYSMDVLVAAAILWAAIRIAKNPSTKNAIVLVLVGAVGMFASHPTVFVLAGVSIWLVLARKFKTSFLAPIFAAWAILLLLDYLFFLHPLEQNAGLQHHWAAAYPPLSPDIFPWLCSAALQLFAGYDTMWLRFSVFGVWPAYAAMILAIFGAYQLFRRGVLDLVLWPIGLTFLAATARKYPFDDRLLLFLVSLDVILIAASLQGRFRYFASILLGFILIGCITRQMIFTLHPPGREEIKPVLSYLHDHWQPGDILYLYRPADTAYLYYRNQFGLAAIPFIHGQWQHGDPAAFESDWQQLSAHRRVWILFSHDLPTPTGDERSEFLQLMQDHRAQLLQTFQAPGAAVYLFNTTFSRRGLAAISTSPRGRGGY